MPRSLANHGRVFRHGMLPDSLPLPLSQQRRGLFRAPPQGAGADDEGGEEGERQGGGTG